MNENRNLLICVICFLVLYLGWCIFLVCAISKDRDDKKNVKFDERQITAQGAAYKWAFFSMLGYYLLYMIVSGAGKIVWCDEILGMMLGVLIGVTVLCVICILRDAYLRINQSKLSAILVINLVCGSQGLIGLGHLTDGKLIEDGVLSGNCLQLFFLLMCLVIDAAFLVKHRMEKREAQE